MRKVYSDASLNYSQGVKFDVPKEFKPCDERVEQTDDDILDVYE